MSTDPTAALLELLQQHLGPGRMPTYPLLPMKVTGLICQGARLEARDPEGYTPLIRCLAAGVQGAGDDVILQTIAALLRGGADITATDPEGCPAADLAATWASDAASLLIADAKTRRLQQPHDGSRPTFLLFYLLETPPEDTSPLHYGPLPKLVDAGADVTARNADGLTVLHLLLERGPLSSGELSTFYIIVRGLLRAGVDIDTPHPDGRSIETLGSGADAEQLALRCIKAERVRRADPYLRQHLREIQFWWPLPGVTVGEGARGEFLNSCKNGKLDHIRYMLHVHPESCHWTDEDANSGLSLALLCGENAVTATQLLLAAGARPDHQNAHGLSPLMLACKWADAVDCIDLLIDKEADATLLCDQGRTAADYARDETADAAALARLHNALSRRQQRDAARAARRQASLAKSRKFKL